MTVKPDVMHGDCRKVVPELVEKHGKFDFIFVDPTFNDGGNDRCPYDVEGYRLFINECVEILWKACNGVIALHGTDELAENYLNIAKELGMVERIAWMNWYYPPKQNRTATWNKDRWHCLVYAKNNYWTWFPQEVMVNHIDGKRLPGTTWGITEEDILPDDSPPTKPRNQLPEVYLERLIKAYTRLGDRVI